MQTTEVPDDYDDALARWTIRALYALAIGLNVWVAWYELKGRPEVGVARVKAERALRRFSAPLRDRHLFRRQANRVLYEAEQAVADA